MKKELVWNVYNYDFNKGKIEKYNIFEHGSFIEDFKKHVKKYKKDEDKVAFVEEIKRELHYYFWSKCEWEVLLTKKDDRIIITPWIGKNDEDICIDVTDDKDFDWTKFYEKAISGYIKKDNTVKIDVYDQIRFKWDEFVEYIINNL